MFHKQLEADLKAIFKVKAVRFCAAAETLEQDVLCVDITSVRNRARAGYAWARVSGSVAIKGAAKKNPAGLLAKKLYEAPAQILTRFWFSGRETPVQSLMSWELKTYQMDFTYFYEEEYAPVKGLIEYAKLFWRYVIGE